MLVAMRSRLRVAVAAMLCAAMACAASASDDCAVQARKRTLVGPKPLVTRLHAMAVRGSPSFERYEFNHEEFRYLGQVRLASGKRWHVVFVSTVSGISCRGTQRLFVFRRDMTYLGSYSHVNGYQPKVVRDAIVYDDVDPEYGNRIRFGERGPPKQILIDGEPHGFYRE